jgi:glycogen operon protein
MHSWDGLSVLPGRTHALGARLLADGVNFALASPNATSVDLCLFDPEGRLETARIAMLHQRNGVWSGFLPHGAAGLVYGWRVSGPWDPRNGHRFNPAKVLLDPYALEVVGSYDGSDLHVGHSAADESLPDPRDNATTALKARVVAELPAVSTRVQVAAGSRVIYEVHVKGFTALHPEVPESLRGTFAGLAHPKVLAYLKRLGVTTLCLMPVAQRADESRLLKLGLTNYWGYSPIAWNAPEVRYWSGTPGTTPRSEFRQMMDALHAAGLDVVLDVVYNHTAETDERGPTLSLRGIDNAMYYQLDPQQPQHYLNWTGCGNCLNLNHPLVLRTVMDSLRHWVTEFGVDGFRFDLAPVLGRGERKNGYAYSEQAPFFMALAQDPALADRLMIAEPWDIGSGGYQLGQFPPGWLEWNDRFRDTQRSFWLQEKEDLSALAKKMAGSADAFAPQRRAPWSSVNFVTAHDGFTLTDLVSYVHRHNEANGENNRDGHAHNLSVNFGVEGPTDLASVLLQRMQSKRVLLAMTLLSLGTPMLLAGDDLGHSQNGNNNAYCQDNPGTWLDWDKAEYSLSTFVSRLIAVRSQRTVLQGFDWWSEPDSRGNILASWFQPDGTLMTPTTWHDERARAMAVLLETRTATDGGLVSQYAPCLLLMNATTVAVEFVLPPYSWIRHVDTHNGDIEDEMLSGTLFLPPESLCLASTHPMIPFVHNSVQ